MANVKNRQAVEEALRTELERDRTKTYVVEISPLGLVEMTRQNVTDGPREVMTRKCPTCGGDGIVVSDATVALQIERRLRVLAAAGAGSRVQAYKVALHPRVLSLLAGPGGSRLAALEDATRRRFYLVPADGHAHADHFEVLAEGRRADLEPGAPVEEGARVELKLGEIDLHDGTAAVGKVDGFEVVVADAAKLVGKKATADIGRVLEGRALAVLVDAEPGELPITFESEAEKPTRAAPSRRKADEASAPAAGAGTVTDEPDVVSEPDVVAETAEGELAADVAQADGGQEEEEPTGDAPARKRTRRGSRGGKRRKKPAVTTADADGEEAMSKPAATTADADGEEAVSDDESAVVAGDGDHDGSPSSPSRRRKPRIHVPGDDQRETESALAAALDDVSVDGAGELTDLADPDASDEVEAPVAGAPPRKRTRRGSRGGRNRKRKPAAANGDGVAGAEAAEATEPAAETTPAVADAEPGDAGYVPMSEWIEDFDRRP
jgi:ribonuclease G